MGVSTTDIFCAFTGFENTAFKIGMSVETPSSPRPTSTGTGNVNVENETEAVNNRDITDTMVTTEANQANAGFDEDDDLGITEETAAAIDSIVSSIDVVEELQDDVDLGLDVIPDDPGH